MVAYSFKSSFVLPIQHRTKVNTIRNPRKRHAREGEQLQLYCGMRTKSCFKIVPDMTCMVSVPIRFAIEPKSLHCIELFEGRMELDPEFHHAFAIRDGFDSMEQMARFWRMTHDQTFFEGQLIGWDDLPEEWMR